MVDTATASPSPQAQASPSSVTLPGGIKINAPSGSGTTTDLFGLGAWRDQPIDTSGFPAAVVVALRNAGINTSQPVKASDLAKALEGIKDPLAVAQLQQMLLYSGMYSSGVTLSDLDLGRFGPKDTAALANAIQTAGSTSSSLGSYLTTAARTGVALGVVGGTAKPLTAPSPVDEDAALRQAAHDLMGREPSPEDLAGFRAIYDQAYLAGQKQAQDEAAQASAQAANPQELGAAMGRLGIANPATGLPVGDAAEAPPSTVPGLPASQERNPDFAGTDAFHPANPAFGAYQTQRAADLNTVGQANSALGGQPQVLRDAPNISDAAEQYLRDHDAGAVEQQNAVTKYANVLAFIRGNGSIQ